MKIELKPNAVTVSSDLHSGQSLYAVCELFSFLTYFPSMTVGMPFHIHPGNVLLVEDTSGLSLGKSPRDFPQISSLPDPIDNPDPSGSLQLALPY
jgi:hypothetical protein